MSAGAMIGSIPTYAPPAQGRHATAQHGCWPASAATLWRLLGVLPDLLVSALAGFTVSAMALMLFGAFDPLPVMLLGCAAGLAFARFAIVPLPALPVGERAPVLLATGLCVFAAVGNAAMSAEYLFIARDPAIYTAAARWLMDHPSLVIHTQAGVFGAHPGLEPGSPGFEAIADGRVAVQGLQGLPVLMAVGGWVAGEGGLLRVNALVGALALLAVFGLVRRVAGSWPALGAMSVLTVSLPFLAFTRSAYTEPLTTVFLVGGLGVLWRGIEERRLTCVLAAGTVLGSAALVRIDGYLALPCLVVVGAVMMASGLPVGLAAGVRRTGVADAVALLAPVVAISALALATLDRLGQSYLRLIRPELLTLGAFTLILVLGCAAVLISVRASPGVRAVLTRARPGIGVGAGLAVLVGFAALASRPLWLVSRLNSPVGFEQLGELQARLGLPIEPQRSYEEQTLNWLAAYLGWPVVVLGAIGLAWLTYRAIAGWQPHLLPVVLVVLAVATVYLNRTGIFPDQIWAVRRFMPVVIPGLLVGTAAALGAVARRGRGGVVAASASWLLIMGTTAAASAPLVAKAEYAGELTEVLAVCARLGSDGALLLEGGYPNLGYVQPFRSFCDVPVQTATELTPALLAGAQHAAATHGRRLYVGAVVGAVPPAERRDSLTLVTASRMQMWDKPFGVAPRGVVAYVRSVYLGTVTPEGTITPLG